MQHMHLHAYTLKRSNSTYQLDAGDVLLCTPYLSDVDKVTVLCRMDDGYRPACNLNKSELDKMPKAALLEWAKL